MCLEDLRNNSDLKMGFLISAKNIGRRMFVDPFVHENLMVMAVGTILGFYMLRETDLSARHPVFGSVIFLVGVSLGSQVQKELGDDGFRGSNPSEDRSS